MSPASSELVGLREYARRRGVSLKAVQKAISTGRLKRSVVETGGRRRLDVAAADREWDRRTHTRKAMAEDAKRAAKTAAAPAKKKASKKAAKKAAKKKPAPSPAAEPRQESGRGLEVSGPQKSFPGGVLDVGGAKALVGRPLEAGAMFDELDVEGERGPEEREDLAEALRRKEVALANWQELRVAEAEGRLVDAGEMRRELHSANARVRELLLGLPARLAVELAAVTDPAEIERKLYAETSNALEELAGGARLG